MAVEGSSGASLIENRWHSTLSAKLNAAGLLLYRSTLLGADKRVTNFGEGNILAKIPMQDPDKILALPPLFSGPADEDTIVGVYPPCTFNLNPRAPSIDTRLHGLLKWAHVDHMHPDAVIAIIASKDSRTLAEDIWGGEIGWTLQTTKNELDADSIAEHYQLRAGDLNRNCSTDANRFWRVPARCLARPLIPSRSTVLAAIEQGRQ
jgi:hypothetical protein